MVHGRSASRVARGVFWVALSALCALAFVSRSPPPAQADARHTMVAAAAIAPPPVVPTWKPEPMVFGYFDHTAQWYRKRPQIAANQTVAQTWSVPDVSALVVLYNDITSTKGAGATDPATVRQRVAERSRDIGGYLDEAAKNGRVRVLLQLPPVLVEQWPTATENMTSLLREFIKQWRDKPALAGFYVYDEPELSQIPAATLQAITKIIKSDAAAGRNTSAISVASSAVSEGKALLSAYASAAPPVFDELLVNRYPVYRSYGRSPGEGSTDFAVKKLGIAQDKAREWNLVDNEYINLDKYYDSLIEATRIAHMDGRPMFAAMQAYGLRDDCAGPSCVATGGRHARRSPTWGELVTMLSSVWMSGMDGAVLYSHYFALYDAALSKRLSNLETLMSQIYRNQPVRGAGVSVGSAHGRNADRAGLRVAYVPDPRGSAMYYLIVMHQRKSNSSYEVELSPQLRVSDVRERRFDAQGNALEPQKVTFERNQGVASAFNVAMDGVGVRIFELAHQ